MKRFVIDASVLAKAFAPTDERHVEQVVRLLESWETGAVEFVAPELLMLEVLNVAARKWLLAEPALLVLATALDDMQIDLRRVDASRLAHWTAAGLTAYDAAYVAVAEAERIPLVTDDEQILQAAPAHAVALGSMPA